MDKKDKYVLGLFIVALVCSITMIIVGAMSIVNNFGTGLK